jgi:DNA-binding response OmpR family regulator
MEKIKILLVEDEEILAIVVKETLEKRGFVIAIATNGVEGWNKFKYDKPDICLIDIIIPRKDGLSLVADIRKVDELVPIIFVTAKTQTADVLKGLEIGADDYIKKPFSMDELVLRIKGLIRRTARATKELFWHRDSYPIIQ